jgi:hypothetical protein
MSEWKPPPRLLRAILLYHDVEVMDRFIDLANGLLFNDARFPAPATLCDLLRVARMLRDPDYKTYAIFMLLIFDPRVCEAVERHDKEAVIQPFLVQLKTLLERFLTGLKPVDGGRYEKDDALALTMNAVPYFVDAMRSYYLML